MTDYYGNPPAYMGFVGYVQVKAATDGFISGIPANGFTVRATSADIRMTQEITKPDVVDSRYDRTVYQLGPKLVDGSLTYPALYDENASFETMFRLAATRHATTGLLSPVDLYVKYTTGVSMYYQGCIVNTWQFSVAQSDVVNCTIDVMGLKRESIDMTAPGRASWDTVCSDNVTGGVSTTRIVTWADARVELNVGTLAMITGQYIRSFEANINNDAERFYTLNTQLSPQAVAPRKREVTGQVVLLGRNETLASRALNNENECYEDSSIQFGFTGHTSSTCDPTPFSVLITNVVYEIEEMALTNDLFETTVRWHAFPSAGTGTCDPLVAHIGDAFHY